MDYGIRKNFGLALLVKFWIHQSIIQNMHHSKKALQIHQSVTKICIPDSKIHNLKKKKAFQIHESVIELDFQIQQSKNQ